jgi:hypothetical protein
MLQMRGFLSKALVDKLAMQQVDLLDRFVGHLHRYNYLNQISDLLHQQRFVHDLAGDKRDDLPR